MGSSHSNPDHDSGSHRDTTPTQIPTPPASRRITPDPHRDTTPTTIPTQLPSGPDPAKLMDRRYINWMNAQDKPTTSDGKFEKKDTYSQCKTINGYSCDSKYEPSGNVPSNESCEDYWAACHNHYGNRGCGCRGTGSSSPKSKGITTYTGCGLTFQARYNYNKHCGKSDIITGTLDDSTLQANPMKKEETVYVCGDKTYRTKPEDAKCLTTMFIPPE